MPYTLVKFLLWFALAALIGGAIGWALRSLRARTQLPAARTGVVDGAELERLQRRLTELDEAIAERDRLRMQVADMRATDSPGIVGAAPDDVRDGGAGGHIAAVAADEVLVGGTADHPMPDPADVNTDVDIDVADAPSDPDQVMPPVSADFADATPTDDLDEPADGTGEEPSDGPSADLDLVAAQSVLGRKVELDDLTVVEGIGPKISELCRGIGVTTWSGLAGTDVAELRDMLDAAGSRYQVHDPATWPHQAELLAAGEWGRLRQLTDELATGR